jgi:hypothetical protein
MKLKFNAEIACLLLGVRAEAISRPNQSTHAAGEFSSRIAVETL